MRRSWRGTQRRAGRSRALRRVTPPRTCLNWRPGAPPPTCTLSIASCDTSGSADRRTAAVSRLQLAAGLQRGFSYARGAVNRSHKALQSSQNATVAQQHSRPAGAALPPPPPAARWPVARAPSAWRSWRPRTRLSWTPASTTSTWRCVAWPEQQSRCALLSLGAHLSERPRRPSPNSPVPPRRPHPDAVHPELGGGTARAGAGARAAGAGVPAVPPPVCLGDPRLPRHCLPVRLAASCRSPL